MHTRVLTLANEALPVMLDRIVPSYAAILLSVTLVLIFGEVVPSAIFTGTLDPFRSSIRLLRSSRL